MAERVFIIKCTGTIRSHCWVKKSAEISIHIYVASVPALYKNSYARVAKQNAKCLCLLRCSVNGHNNSV